MTNFPEIISLNVGGRHFDTTLSTLLKYEDSMLAAMFSGRHRVVTDKDDRYFIDRDGSQFGHILEFLRQDKLPPPEVAKAVLEDAEFYGLHQLSEKMETTYAIIFLETFLRKRRDDFLEAHPKLASLTLDVIDEARKKFQESPTQTSSVTIWIPSERPLFPKEVLRSSVHDCTTGCLIVDHIPQDVMNEYIKYSSSQLQECGYKVDVELNDKHCVNKVYCCPDCMIILAPEIDMCPRCSRFLNYNYTACGSQKLCFIFRWSQNFPEVISLNVGGRHFDTTLTTLLRYEDSMLAAMFSGRHRVVTDKVVCSETFSLIFS
uniref:BTB domain-containing protein n=1 Tax=Branchiostoma floridae TaxID=7739 RepID=C3Y652_BRAFL|eukprot:XP_002608439.1 hypothetical protein BRAFLDRAFT_96577 [Branchiostoma floridae]